MSFLRISAAKVVPRLHLDDLRRDLLHLEVFLRDRGGLRVNTAVLRAWVDSQLDLGRAPATVARRVSSVRSFFAWASASGLIPSNPAAALESPRARTQTPHVLADIDVEKFLDPGVVIDESVIILILALLGLRVGELVKLRVLDVDFGRGEIRVPGKGSRHRVFPFTGQTPNRLGRNAQHPPPETERGRQVVSLLGCSGCPTPGKGAW